MGTAVEPLELELLVHSLGEGRILFAEMNTLGENMHEEHILAVEGKEVLCSITANSYTIKLW